MTKSLRTPSRPRSPGSAALLFVASLLPIAGGCALSAPPAEQTLRSTAAPLGAAAATLAADPANDALPQDPAVRQARLDELARQALAAADAAVTDADAQLRAAAVLFQAADLRMQRAALAWLDEHPDATLAEVLAVEDRIGDPARSEILSLCTSGLDRADRALAAAPHSAAARLYQALHLAWIAWANGPARSLVAGYGTRLVTALDGVLALEPTLDHCAPLRLQGRFRSKAPWPYGDQAAADAALERATREAPLVVNHLFYGDALAAKGDLVGAVAEWRRAAGASADDSTRWSADLLRELARRRLARAGG